jgi:hypothetical protein
MQTVLVGYWRLSNGFSSLGQCICNLQLKIMLINSARVCAVGIDALNMPYGSHAFNESCMVPALRGV